MANQGTRRLAAVAFGLATTVVLVGLLEVGCRVALARRGESHITTLGDYDKGFLRRHGRLGYRPRASATAWVKKRYDDQVVFDVHYSTDDHHRRVTPSTGSDPVGRFAAFFGCSFTFGVGLNDTETFPNVAAAASPGVRVYNYGLGGYGPANTLAALESLDFAVEIPESSGIAVYTWIDGHIKRAIGARSIVQAWGENFPRYVLGSDGFVRRDGTFKIERLRSPRPFEALADSGIARYFGVDVPVVVTPHHIDTVVGIFKTSRKLAKERMGASEFYVALYPGCHPPERLLTGLEAAGVPVLDFRDLFDPSDPLYHIAHDGHPSARAAKEYGAALAAFIARNEGVSHASA